MFEFNRKQKIDIQDLHTVFFKNNLDYFIKLKGKNKSLQESVEFEIKRSVFESN
jgi:hypothetical protein